MSDHSHDPHDDFLEAGIPHVSVKEYATGFGLSVVLTAIPFWLVMAKVLPTPTITLLVILAFAMVQVVVHMVYFLHMNPKSEGGWNLLALIFTAVLLVIVLIGTLWVMHHMNANMMPSMHDMERML
ncbi:cytochrome o ubiquinol oxidase subunit IV [Luteimonas kalidii]|uniref:Cytochrome bo(3) ubiquinol oxidase subunit 4 n=1 Tax=Luteimonas kalidii TaxID=3042025 RepID=A0ABT6JPX5_9GAMM|nr:cytochrome o ubiquinol oxidase subunit IV [Luteimonas kalidii]MDH5832664.1 cytochrome o ubiquinol oxidase subunit IV [Luteimonas kalidii]